jgi:hypothetical protein
MTSRNRGKSNGARGQTVEALKRRPYMAAKWSPRFNCAAIQRITNPGLRPPLEFPTVRRNLKSEISNLKFA